MTISVLGNTQIGHRAKVRIELGQIPAAGLAMEHGHDLHGGPFCGNVRIARTAVTDDADVLIEVDGIHFGKLAHAGDGFQDTHGHADLDIALHSAGHALLDEHGESRDQHGIQYARLALGEAVIVAGDESNLLVLHPLLEGYHILRHLPNFFNGAAAFNIEGVQDVLRLGADGCFIGDVVGDGPHLFPIELLGVQAHAVIEIGFVDIQVHHAGIGPSDLGQVGVPEAAAHLGGLAPVKNFGLYLRIAVLHHTGDDRVTLARPFQVGHHFANGPAGVEFAQPGGGVSVGVIGGFLFLYVHQHHRHIQIPDSGEHVVAGSVGEQLQDHQIHVRRPELVPSFHSLFLGGHDAAIHQFHGIGDQLFEILILALKLRHQGRELGQVRA